MKRETYKAIQDAVKDVSGLNLGEHKEYLIEARIKPLALLAGHQDLDTFVVWLKQNQEKWDNLLSQHLATHETYFFRDMDIYTDFVNMMLPSMPQKSTIRVWSAACSTGQEPYSLVMAWKEHEARFPGQFLKIVATDFADKPLEKAKEGLYTQYEVQRGLPIQYLVKYFNKEATEWRVKPELKQFIHFEQDNLLHPAPYHQGYDVIFVRNVLIYLDIDTKKKVIADLHKRLNEGGYLVLGAAESLFGINDKFKRVTHGKSMFYQKVNGHEN